MTNAMHAMQNSEFVVFICATKPIVCEYGFFKLPVGPGKAVQIESKPHCVLRNT